MFWVEIFLRIIKRGASVRDQRVRNEYFCKCRFCSRFVLPSHRNLATDEYCSPFFSRLDWIQYVMIFLLKDITGGKGPNVILEMLASTNLQKDMDMIADRGRIAVSY